MLAKNSLATIVLLIAVLQATESLSQEQQIYNKIFTGYSKDLRPILNSSHSVRVDVKFELIKIKEIDEVKQVMHVVGFLIAKWKDEYLVWNSTDYGGINRIVIPASQVWLPDFAIVNSADTFYHGEFVADFRVLITNTGEVRWSFGGNLAVSCELDLTYYPFDKQLCSLQLENWSYDASEVQLVNATSEIQKDQYHKNGMWAVTRTAAYGGHIYHAAYPGVPYPLVTFQIYMARKSGYYDLNIVGPCLLLAILALLSFWLPADAGEKVGMGITIILAFGVFSLLIAQNTPRTSDSFPILSLLMCFLISMSTLDTMMSIVVLYLHHHLPTRPPPWMRLVFLHGLGRLVCMLPGTSGTRLAKHDEVHEIIDGRPEVPLPGVVKKMAAEGSTEPLLCIVRDVAQQLKVITQSMRDQQADVTNMDEWKAMARILDRFMFWVNFLIITVVTVTCLVLRGPDPTGVPA